MTAAAMRCEVRDIAIYPFNQSFFLEIYDFVPVPGAWDDDMRHRCVTVSNGKFAASSSILAVLLPRPEFGLRILFL